jgi:REP element-mobilizing transposase RayT
MSYDPSQHHRRSIRLKGHDYAGGGVYFVTICAHREMLKAAGGKPFEGALRQLSEERLQITAEKCPQMRWGEWVIMPDHFHGIIHMQKGALRLGDVIGGFKAAVSREWNKASQGTTRASPVRRRGEACLALALPLAPSPADPANPPAPRMWHRNYYERIVRSKEAEERITEYIRMNPWRCVQELGSGLRGIGNPALWTGEKLGVLCSRNAPKIGRLPTADVYFGGWHSPKEKEILDWLMKNGRRVIACPAWGIEKSSFAPGVRKALEENRMLIVEMRDVTGNLAAAKSRNRFVIENADTLFTPHISPGGMLDRLMKTADQPQK